MKNHGRRRYTPPKAHLRRARVSRFLSVTLGFFVLAPAVAAQSVGDRVRVALLTEFSVVGEVTQVDGMGFTIDMGAQTGSMQIASSDVESIERSVGTKNRAVLVASIGGLAGVAVAASKGYAGFAIFGATVTEADNRSDTRTFGLIASGALIGAGIGALIKTDVWEEVPLGDQVSLRPVINAGFGRHGAKAPVLHLGARIRF